MTRGTQRARKDGNQAGIEQALKQLEGVSYFDTSALGRGFPDLTVGYNGVNYYFEIKKECANPLKELTKAEEKFMAGWEGHYAVVTTIEEIKREIGYGG